MKKSSNQLIASILIVGVLATAFFVLALHPAQQEASKLSGEAEQLSLSLSESRAKAAQALEAKHDFPADYQQLVVLGTAVPASDDTSSLLVELNRIADRSEVEFDSMQLGSGSGESLPAPAPTPAPTEPPASAASAGSSGAVPAAATVPPTEAAASLMPLGSTIGPAGLAVMPYDLTFTGNFFHIADFIKGLDSLVHTGGRTVAVDGRLLTLNGFALNADPEVGFPDLQATFSVTTYLTPPATGITAGATPSAPAPVTATPAATSEEAAPPAEATNASTPR
jgi:Tfp pilus assembly protein PilO